MEQVEKVFQYFDLNDLMITSIKNDDARVKYVIDHMCKNGVSKIIQDLDVVKKIPQLAELFRNRGTYYFNSSNDKAIEEYTMSIAYSPPRSREMALAYGNRSAVLLKVKLYSDCLIDVERALDNPLIPDNVKTKLYLRKVTCLQAVKPEDTVPIEQALDEARKWLEFVDNKSLESLKKKIMDQMKSALIPRTPAAEKPWEEKIPELKSENPAMPGTSDAASLAYSNKFGRHMIATRDIKAGETVSVQKIYAKTVFLKERYKICWHCAKQTWTSVPCEDCVNVIYCSETCREKDKHEHVVECITLGLMTRSQLFTDSHVFSLKLVIKALNEAGGSLEILENNLQKIDAEKDPMKKGFINGVFDSSKFAAVYSLESNSDKFIDEKASDQFRCVLIAYFLASRSNFFNKQMSQDLSSLRENKKFIFLVQLLEKMLHITTINGFSKGNSYPRMGNIEHFKFFGVISPAQSFFNHSCYTVLSTNNHGDYGSIRATVSIKKGEQLFFSYGPDYKETPREQRQEYLQKHYGFKCECVACVNNWSANPDYSVPKDLNPMLEAQLAFLTRKMMDLQMERLSLTRTKNHFIDVTKELADAAELTHQFCNKLPRNNYFVICASHLLAGMFLLEEDRHLTLD